MILTPSTRHLTRFEIDFLPKGTRFRRTFVLRVRVFDAFWCPNWLAPWHPGPLASWPPGALAP